jgi:hypothetical protein
MKHNSHLKRKIIVANPAHFEHTARIVHRVIERSRKTTTLLPLSLNKEGLFKCNY